MTNAQKQYPEMDKAFYWYLAHQNELVPQYDGKYLVISNNQVHGAYDDVVDAVSVGDREYTRGKFIVQRCSPGKKDTTVRITPFRISKL